MYGNGHLERLLVIALLVLLEEAITVIMAINIQLVIATTTAQAITTMVLVSVFHFFSSLIESLKITV